MKFKFNKKSNSTFLTNNYWLLLLLFSIVYFGFKKPDVNIGSTKSDVVTASSKKLLYCGRVLVNDTDALFINSSTAVEMNFTGSEIAATLKSSGNDSCFLVIVDNDMSNATKIKTSTVQESYVLAAGLGEGKHNIKLLKVLPNWVAAYFYQFDVTGGKAQKAPEPLKRKIEFYGDSQTEGNFSDAPLGPDPKGTGNLYNNSNSTYAALTAKYFNAQYSNISYSGVGLVAGYTNFLMTEVYDAYNPRKTDVKWDFKNYVPDIIVINLFQNDFSISNSPESPNYKKFFTDRSLVPSDSLFVAAYKNFIGRLHVIHPNAHIICALGSMNVTKQDKWKGYVTKAVDELRSSTGYSKIYTLYFPSKGTEGHPKASEHAAMADSLISFIREKGIWQ